eukprot:9885679-Alexandrium_andersonii.AAC.1
MGIRRGVPRHSRAVSGSARRRLRSLVVSARSVFCALRMRVEFAKSNSLRVDPRRWVLSLIHISEPTRLALI